MATDPNTLDTPSNSDIAAANPLQTTAATSDAQIPMPTNTPASGAPTPTQPTAPTAQPQAPVANAQATPAQKAQALHASIFTNILGTLAGGSNRPVMGPNGQPQTNPDGTVQMAPASKKALGASILAGALSAMVAGMATPDKRTELGGGRSIADYSGSAAAGANASQPFTQAGTQQKAQGQIDENQARAMATADHNLKFHMMSVASDKADREGQQDVVDAHSSMNDAMDTAYANGNITDANGNTVELYKQRGILGTEVQKLVLDKSLNITSDMITPVSVIDVPNRNGDGGSHAETLFDVFNPSAMVAMSDDIRKDNPRLYSVANGTPLPVRVLASNALKISTGSLASSGLENQSKAYNDAVKGTNIPAISSTFDLTAATKTNPLIEKLYPYINKYRKDSIDAMFNDFQKDPDIAKNPTLQTASAMLQRAMGVSPDGLQKMADKRDAEKKAAAKGNDAMPAPSGIVGSFAADVQTAYPNLTKGQVALLTKALGQTPTNADYTKQQETAQKYSDNNTKLAAAQASKDDAAIAKGAKPVVGIDASGKQVLVPAGDVSKYGLSQVREVGQAENEKVTNARSLMTVFNNTDSDDLGLIQLATKLNKDDKLGPVASKLQDWYNKGGSVLTFDAAGDTDVQRLFTKLGLSTTGLMQVHVGARGSAAMLEHFADLANAKKMSGDSFLAALDTENKYVQMKAMLPNVKQATQQTQQTQQNQSKATTKPTGAFDPSALPKAN